ncbi:MAG: ribonuclease E activity regulator RraA [Gammaproteobacteria bacterium]|nr:ribonuclease E activity regulator RraA [Gammaproteobacteria bacterium]
MSFDTADLCDRYGDRVRVIDAGLRHFGGVNRFHGEVATVRVQSDFLLAKKALSRPGRERVLVVDGGGAREFALLGDRLADLGVSNGWAGVVVNGCIRDSARIATMNLGVLALGTCPRRPAMKGGGTEEAVISIGGIAVGPGNWVYIDDDGMVVSPSPLAV